MLDCCNRMLKKFDQKNNQSDQSSLTSVKNSNAWLIFETLSRGFLSKNNFSENTQSNVSGLNRKTWTHTSVQKTRLHVCVLILSVLSRTSHDKNRFQEAIQLKNMLKFISKLHFLLISIFFYGKQNNFYVAQMPTSISLHQNKKALNPFYHKKYFW